MTKLLEIALTKVAQLPDAEQDRIAQLVLDAIDDAARWQATFAALCSERFGGSTRRVV